MNYLTHYVSGAWNSLFNRDKYKYVVVGAGTGGCTTAYFLGEYSTRMSNENAEPNINIYFCSSQNERK